MEMYPGTSGLVLALACTGVVFVAGAKLLDSVRPEPVAANAVGPHAPRGSAAAVQRYS